jgi:hypothetical protein
VKVITLGDLCHTHELELLDPSEREQLEVLVEALNKFRERNAKYRDLWKEGGWSDSAHHVRHKAARVSMCLRGSEHEDGHFSSGDPEHLVLLEEEAIDLINYATFFIRNVRALEHGA